MLKQELDAPDLWNGYQQATTFNESLTADDIDNRPFDQTERELITTALDDIKAQLVSMHHWNHQQVAIIDEQFEQMETSLDRIGTKDWKLFFYGALTSVLVNLSVTHEQGRSILAFAVTILTPILETVKLIN